MFSKTRAQPSKARPSCAGHAASSLGKGRAGGRAARRSRVAGQGCEALRRIFQEQQLLNPSQPVFQLQNSHFAVRHVRFSRRYNRCLTAKDPARAGAQAPLGARRGHRGWAPACSQLRCLDTFADSDAHGPVLPKLGRWLPARPHIRRWAETSAAQSSWVFRQQNGVRGGTRRGGSRGAMAPNPCYSLLGLHGAHRVDTIDALIAGGGF